jgi:hypothetical protein
MFDPCIYTFRTGNIFAMIALYVDYIPFACNDTSWMQAFKETSAQGLRLKTW